MVLVAFIAVIIIWSTTPLAIQWSSQDVGFIFGVAGRMILGAAACVLVLLLLKRRLPLDRASLNTYFAASSGIYAAMLCVYWGAQFIPSGLVSVLFGLTPIVTALMAHIWLGEKSLTIGKLLGASMGLLGIALIFQSDLMLTNKGIYGMLAVLAAVFIHCGSTVWIKRVGTRMSPLELTTGSLLFVSPLFCVTWFFVDGQMPTSVPLKSSLSIVYLGIMGSVVGFTLYFYILRNLEASRVALTTVVTPVVALLLGHVINDEQIALQIWVGVACILSALVMHQWGDRLITQLAVNEKRMPNVDGEG